MSAAGFEGAVAPLGTALTEDQIGLLWRMAEEPILCFDGDKAGTRAAFRAVDLALPRLAPGKSLRFAILPEGQDPDDLIKSAGADAMNEVLGKARPLAEMLWLRETADSNLDTPERRAALEQRLGEILRTIADETVRRYYREDFQGRLARLFAPAATAPAPYRPSAARGAFRNDNRNPARRLPSPQLGGSMRSSQFALRSVAHRNQAEVPPREALMLLVLINHPWLLAEHAEELAAIEFQNRDAESLRRALLAAAASDAAEDFASLQAHLGASDASELQARMERAISHRGDWPVRPDAAREDVISFWHQIASLHRRKRTLSKELKEAEHALGAEPTDANFARLKDVQERLTLLDGTEALIEGFGESSGRSARSM
jgi:DNA primase